MQEPERSASAGTRRRALFVSADLPWPPDGGGRIASLRNLRAFARIYDTDLVALADSVGEPDLSELRRICRRVIVIRIPFTFGRHRLRQGFEAVRSLFSRDPYRIRKFRTSELRRTIARLRDETQYDIVHFDQFGVAPYWVPDVPTTHSCQNIESDIYRMAAAKSRNPIARLWAWQEGIKLRRAERKLLRRFDVVLALVDEDRLLLERLGCRSVEVIRMPAPPIRTVGTPPAEPVLLSLGTMSWFGVEEGLLWFWREVYPRVREQVPAVRWQIVGPNAGPAIRRLNGSDGISVLGYVDDLDSAFASTRVAIVPLHIAGGVRMKLLDLMAAGIPSVATQVGARGLACEDGQGSFRRDDPEEFADALVALLTDDALWARTARLGQQYVADHHSESSFLAALEKAAQTAISQHMESTVEVR
jgi:glycosyltransferase involved in cell wall biosynthesis